MIYRSGYWYRWGIEHDSSQTTFLKFDGVDNVSLGFWIGCPGKGWEGLNDSAIDEWTEVVEPMEIQFLESRFRSDQTIYQGDMDEYLASFDSTPEEQVNLQEGEWCIFTTVPESDTEVYLIKVAEVKPRSAKSVPLVYSDCYYVLTSAAKEPSKNQGGAFQLNCFLRYADEADLEGVEESFDHLEPEEDKLDRAKREYPVGTRFICVQTGKTKVVNEESFRYYNGNTEKIDQYGGGFVYCKGKWAKPALALTLENAETTEDKVKCLVEGGTYAMTGIGICSNIEAVFKVCKKYLTSIETSHSIDSHNSWTYTNTEEKGVNAIDNPDWVMGFREATDEEKYWLEVCITEKMFLPKDQATGIQVSREMDELVKKLVPGNYYGFMHDGMRNAIHFKEAECVSAGNHNYWEIRYSHRVNNKFFIEDDGFTNTDMIRSLEAFDKHSSDLKWLKACVKLNKHMTKTEAMGLVAEEPPDEFNMGRVNVVVFHPRGDTRVRHSLCVVPGDILQLQNSDGRKVYYTEAAGVEDDTIYGSSWVIHDLITDKITYEHAKNRIKGMAIMEAGAIHQAKVLNVEAEKRWYFYCVHAMGQPIPMNTYIRRGGDFGMLGRGNISRTAQMVAQQQASVWEREGLGMKIVNPYATTFALDHQSAPKEKKKEKKPKHLKKDADGIEDISCLHENEDEKIELDMKVISVDQIDLNL
jgi:hypothetical protein